MRLARGASEEYSLQYSILSRTVKELEIKD